jgi:putative membrane protein
VLSDSTKNLQRRYRHLFTLPARNRTIAYSSIIAVVTNVIARLALRTPVPEVLLYALLGELSLLLSIEIDRIVLRRKSKLATYRRLSSIAIVSDLVWLALTILAVILFLLTRLDSRLLSLLILGAFFAISIRALLIGSLFYQKAWQGVPLAIVQPALIALPMVYSPQLLSYSIFVSNPGPISALVGGVITLVAIELYIFAINRASKTEHFKPIELLQAFLNAWAVEDATNMERVLDFGSKEGTVMSQMLLIKGTGDDSKTALLVVPGLHPGPFYPIGSSNLPFDVFHKLSSNNLVPMVVHSISDHDLNLSSRSQMERYLSTLDTNGPGVESGSGVTSLVIKKANKATVSGISFGLSALITITQSPYGMEDFPVEVKNDIEAYSSKLGFKNLFLIDAHNSEGDKPNEKECLDAIKASREVLDELKNSKRHDFKMGVAHSSEMQRAFEKDIGGGGFGLLLLEIPETGESYSLIIVDANNAFTDFREKVIVDFEKSNPSKILEICTSDTHVTAAKTRDAKGYLALGDFTDPSEFAEILGSLYLKAKSRLAPANFLSFIVASQVKTIGGEILENFSGLLDSASSVAKYGAQVLALLAIAVTIVVALI